VSFDEGPMEDPGKKSPFYYNNIPVVSQANDSDIGEILSSVQISSETPLKKI